MLGILALLVVFQIKHFLADFPFQTPYMLGKFKEKGWLLPLAAHASVHAFMTAAIVKLATDSSALAIVMALFDFVVHFAMDRIKASPKLLGKYKALDANCYTGVAQFAKGEFPFVMTEEDKKQKIQWAQNRLKENTYFWWALGFDQFVHHVTHYIIIAAIFYKG